MLIKEYENNIIKENTRHKSALIIEAIILKKFVIQRSTKDAIE